MFLAMTMIFCCISGKKYEKPNFYRHSKSKKKDIFWKQVEKQSVAKVNHFIILEEQSRRPKYSPCLKSVLFIIITRMKKFPDKNP